MWQRAKEIGNLSVSDAYRKVVSKAREKAGAAAKSKLGRELMAKKSCRLNGEDETFNAILDELNRELSHTALDNLGIFVDSKSPHSSESR
ncbi:MAG TPA: hypothetical protein EYP90_02220, partial [Chromatiaceae bacterium]|nr:hypothetical protein [Chromatiaceae bacterium]